MSHTSSYQGMTPHPDGMTHERMPMANIARVGRNVDLPLPGIVKSAKPTSYHIPTLTHVSSGPHGMPSYPSELHHEGGPAPKTRMMPGMIAVERRC